MKKWVKSDAKPIAVIAADCHIDHLIFRTARQITGDAYWGFSQAVNAALKYDVPLILAGDNVECLPADAPTGETLWFLRSEIERLTSANQQLFWIDGQHDGAMWLQAAAGYDGNRDMQCIEFANQRIAFLSHRRSPRLSDALFEINEIPHDVLICHQAWKELMGTSSSQASIAEYCTAKLVISGDYHKNKMVKMRAETGRSIMAISPGATHARKLDEPTEHYVLVLRDDLSVTRRPLTSRPRMTITVSDEDSVEDEINKLPAAIEQLYANTAKLACPPQITTPIIRLLDMSGIAGVRSRFSAAVGDAAHLFYNKVLRSDIEADETTHAVEEDLKPMTFTDHLAKEIGNDAEAHSLMLAAIAAQDPQQGVRQWRDEYVQVRGEKLDVAIASQSG